MKTSIELDHPVIFILDYKNKDIEVPDFNEKTGASHSPSCISIGAISYMDGKVEINIASREEQSQKTTGLKKIISAKVLSPNKKISVTTSENLKLLEIDSKNTETIVTVFADSSPYAENITILID